MENVNSNQAAQCPNCHGQKYIPCMVYWSDGPGMSAELCPLCQGLGTIARSVLEIALDEKSLRLKAESELNKLKVHTALYLETSKGLLPDPPLLDAPGPSPHASTWLEYLQRATNDLPRLAETTAR